MSRNFHCNTLIVVKVLCERKLCSNFAAENDDGMLYAYQFKARKDWAIQANRHLKAKQRYNY